MQISRLQASFGKLNHDTLELGPGLNVVYGDNEAGKSTWCALLRVILYGLPTRERGELADKYRYQPRSGAPMSGALFLAKDGRTITVTRQTLRPDTPMGAFSAAYTDTAVPVPELTAANCGSTLTGVSREVFERTAFIRQCGMTFQPDASLQQQAAAFLAGDSDSFAAAHDRLKKQLNIRQHNRTGSIPRLDSDISALQTALREIRQLQVQQEKDHEALETMERQQAHLQTLLTRHDAADRAAPLLAAQQELEQARTRVSALRAETSPLPPERFLHTLQSGVVGIEFLQKNVQTAEENCRKAEAVLRNAETSRHLPVLPLILIAASLAALAAGGFFSSLPLLSIGAAALLSSSLWLFLSRRSAATVVRNAENAHRNAAALRDSLLSSLRTSQENILQQVQHFQPEARSTTDCRRIIESSLARYAALEQAAAAEDAALQRVRSFPDPGRVPPHPAKSRTLLQEQLSTLSPQIDALRRTIHTGLGRMQALGDTDILQAELEEKQARRLRLQQEYDAISLAMTTLSAADARLHQQFAPALAEKTAKIFTKLTCGKYNKVLLTQELAPTAQESSGTPSLNAPLLSQGTGDQLYLALRLALCQTVLPEDKAVPIVLDDALVHFDDQRMAAALEVLLELAQTRQILLFTCQRREADWLRQHHPGRFHAVTLL